MDKQINDLKNVPKINQPPGEGLRSLKTSNVFRTLNFELYARPVSNHEKNPTVNFRPARFCSK